MFQQKPLSGNVVATFDLSANITLFHPDAFSPGWFTRVHPCFSCQAGDGIRGGALYNSIAQAIKQHLAFQTLL